MKITKILALVFCFFAFSCNQNGREQKGKFNIVCTIFPEYDWVMEIVGRDNANVNVELLLDNGVDLHSYSPTVEDVAKISTCDMFIYVGGHSDTWVEGALSQAKSKNMIVINLLNELGDAVKAEEVVEGMEHHHHHNEASSAEKGAHSHEEAHEHHDAEEGHLHEEAEESEEHSHSPQKVREDLHFAGLTISQDVTGENKKHFGSAFVNHLFEAGDVLAFLKANLTKFEGSLTSGTTVEVGKTSHAHDNEGVVHITLVEKRNDEKVNHYMEISGFKIDKSAKEDVEKDEHVWLSLRLARLCCLKIAEKLCILDKKNEALYTKNVRAYTKKLKDLDAQYKEMVKESKNKAIVVCDRFPFRYLVDDYGIKYFAAFTGCSAESEASFETVAFLSKKIDELNVDTILTIENSNGKLPATVVENSESKRPRKISAMDSMQSTTAASIKAGATYLGIMSENFKVLKEALN